MIKISEIRRDGGAQARAFINAQTVAEYAEAMSDPNTVFPPVTVYYDGKAYWLADGFHRVAAWEEIGREEIPADVRQGDRRAAILHSTGANAAHGLRRTNEDKRRAVMTLLEDDEWSQWPDTEIAKRVRVGRNFVSKLRGELTCTRSASDDREPVLRKYIDRYGNERTMDVSNIGKSQGRARVLSEQEAGILRGAESPSVYVLSDGSRCKIGWSRTVRRRVEDILRQNPSATVVAVAPGGTPEERAIHDQLECERDVGEWFVVSEARVFEVMTSLGLNVTPNIGKAESAAPVDDTPKPVDEPAQIEAKTADPVDTKPEPEPDPHAKSRTEFRRMTDDAREDDWINLRLEVAESRKRIADQRSQIADLKKEIHDLASGSDLGAALSKKTAEVAALKRARDEALAAAKRMEFRMKKSLARADELERATAIPI